MSTEVTEEFVEHLTSLMEQAKYIPYEAAGSIDNIYNIELYYDTHESWLSDEHWLLLKAMYYIKVTRGKYKGHYKRKKAMYGVTKDFIQSAASLDIIWEHLKDGMVNYLRQKRLLKRPCDWEKARAEFMEIVTKAYPATTK